MKRRKSLKIFLTFATTVDLVPMLAIGLVSATALADSSPSDSARLPAQLASQLDELQKAASSAAVSLNTFAAAAARLEARPASTRSGDRDPASSASSPGQPPTPPSSSTPSSTPSSSPSSSPSSASPEAASPPALSIVPGKAPGTTPRTSIPRDLADDSKIAGYSAPHSDSARPTDPTPPRMHSPRSSAAGLGGASTPAADNPSRDSINSRLDALTALPPLSPPDNSAAPASLARRELPPSPAPRAGSRGNGSVDPNELTLSEIRKEHIFNGFNAEILGRDPDSTAVLRGTVFANCAGYFTFDNTERTHNGDIGFTIRDPGGHGRACVREGRDVLHLTCATTKCISLSHLDGTHIRLAQVGDVRVGLLHDNPNLDDEDPNKIAFEDLGLRPHLSASTIIARRKQAIRERRDAMIGKLRWNIAHCRQNSDQLLQDHSDLELLRDLTHMSESQFKAMNKDLKIAEFNLLKKRANSFNVTKLDRDKLDELLNDLDQFANDNEGFSDATAQIEANLASRITQQHGTDPAAWQTASDILGDASGLPNLGSTWERNVATSQTKVAVGHVTAMAISPKRDNTTFIPAYESLMNTVTQDLSSNCSNSVGVGMAMGQKQTQDCQLAQSAYSSALQIPQEMAMAQMKNAQAEQQRALLQLRMQQNLMFPTGGSTMANPLQPNLAGMSGNPLFSMPNLNLAPAGGLTPF